MRKIFITFVVFNIFGFSYAHSSSSPDQSENAYKKLSGYECAYVIIPDDEENRNLDEYPDLALSEGLVIRDRPSQTGKVLTVASPTVAASFKNISQNGYIYIIDYSGYEGWISKKLVVPFREGRKAGYEIEKNATCSVYYRKWPFPVKENQNNKDLYLKVRYK